MIVYEGNKNSFIEDVNLNYIADKIQSKFYERFHRNVSQSEYNSWRESMFRMCGVLEDPLIPNESGIAIEFNIPHTSNRIDFIISGLDESNNYSVIIVELKQWEHCEAIEGKDGIVKTYTGGAIRETTHPSYQAYSYASLIYSFNQTVYDENISLHPCAFLHNYKIQKDDPICSTQYKEYIDEAPMFGSSDFSLLREFIKKYIKLGDNKEGLYKIENGKIKPSKMLQDAFANVLKGNKEFILIDDQKLIYEEVLKIGTRSLKNNEKNVFIIEGGPGTGKSVLAINLLNAFLQKNANAFYVSKNSAPRDVFKSKLKINKLNKLNNLFKGSGCFVDSNENEFDILLVDEAHRLNEKSGMFHNLGENQIKEIIKSSKTSIFFIDENQRITLDDIGSIDEIKNHANEFNATVYQAKLNSQFRCNGSDGYLAWLDDVLDIRRTANFDLDENYDFKIFDNPNELRTEIINKNKLNNKSRIVAGYCWKWPTNQRKNKDYHDIVIKDKDFEMSWNLDKQIWAIAEDSVNEAGCIHTCQGLEFDYVGVIIGDDLRYENGRIITDYNKRALETDRSLSGIKSIAQKYGVDKAQEIAEPIIKNTYKTLMTRGMIGCYVYCTNKELSDYLKSRLKNKELN